MPQAAPSFGQSAAWSALAGHTGRVLDMEEDVVHLAAAALEASHADVAERDVLLVAAHGCGELEHLLVHRERLEQQVLAQYIAAVSRIGFELVDAWSEAEERDHDLVVQPEAFDASRDVAVLDAGLPLASEDAARQHEGHRQRHGDGAPRPESDRQPEPLKGRVRAIVHVALDGGAATLVRGEGHRSYLQSWHGAGWAAGR
eukprot:scaffold65441_cov66-Phaeocystis_antarctica.AAC.5